MNQYPRLWQINLTNIGWATIILITLLGASGHWSWLVNGLILLIFLSIAVPVTAGLWLRWWWRHHLIEGPCPVCDYQLTGIVNTDCVCPSCGEPLQITPTGIKRLTPPGTIDVEATEIDV